MSKDLLSDEERREIWEKFNDLRLKIDPYFFHMIVDIIEHKISQKIKKLEQELSDARWELYPDRVGR